MKKYSGAPSRLASASRFKEWTVLLAERMFMNISSAAITKMIAEN
jgi:hypothetical protein